ISRTLPRPIRGRGRSLARIVVMAGTFENGGGSRIRVTEKTKRERGNSSLRQRNELGLVGDVREAAALPVRLGLLDPFLGGGDEIPPDMARPFQRIPAEKHHPHGSCRLRRDAVARPE